MKVFNYTAHLAMRKTHTCSYCGAVYTYKLERSVSSADGSFFTRAGASRGADKKAAEVQRNGAEIKPCPNCGRCQSEMFADSIWARFNEPTASTYALLTAVGAFGPYLTFMLIKMFYADGGFQDLKVPTGGDIFAGVLGFFFAFLSPYASWGCLTARLLPTFRNWNRNPERNLEKMKTDETLRSELLGIRPERARKQNVKRWWFIGSALWYAAFSVLYCCAPLGVCFIEKTSIFIYTFYCLGAALIAALGFVFWSKYVPKFARFQGDEPLTTSASAEALALLREHWLEFFEACENEARKSGAENGR